MKVTVRLLSGADHLSQILTGFQMLSRENKLTLDILDCRKDSPVYQEAFLEAQVLSLIHISHSEQNLPLLTAPQLQVQVSSTGLG